MEVALNFRQVECVGCGAARVVGVTCPHCGAVPESWEADPELQRRQREARTALALLDSPGSVETAELTPSELFNSLSTWMDRFMTAVEATGDRRVPAADETSLNTAVQEFAAIKSAAQVAVRRRPWITTWVIADQVLASAESVARSYLACLSADTPLAVQRAAVEGQLALDRAAEQATDLAGRLERAGRVADSGSLTEALINLASEASEIVGSGDVSALDEAGHERFQRVTGSQDCAAGMGATLFLSDLLVDATLDRERFWNSVKETFTVLIAARERLRALLGAQTWLDDFSDATERLFDSMVAQQAVAAAATRDRDHVRAAMTLAQDLLEGPAQRYLSTILTAHRGRRYEKVRKQDAGALVNQVRDAGLASLLVGLDRGLRHARAHESFQLKDGVVVLDRKGGPPESLALDELVDGVLAGMESVFAMQVGMVIAAASLGHDVAKLDALAVLEVDPSERVKVALALAGWTGISVDLVADRLTASGEPAQALTGRTLQDVAMAVAYADEQFETMTLRSQRDGGELAGPLEPLRRSQLVTGELERAAALMDAGRRWMLNGAAVLGPDYVRKWVAMQAAALLNAAPAERGRGLRVLRTLARDLHDEELEQSVIGLQALLRSRELGLPPGPEEQAALDWLAAWEKRRLSDPPW